MTATGKSIPCAGCGEDFVPKSSRQRFHSPKCRKASKSKAAPPEQTPEERVIQWATTHGAPIKLLIGWDPATGEWADGSPIGNILADIARGAPLSVTARRHGFHGMTELMHSGAEFSQTTEDRSLLPVEVRPMVDLYTLVNYHEAGAEIDLSTSTFDKALQDGRLGLEFLGRRWPSRWKEQQSLSLDETDEREAAVTQLVADPATAMALAGMASQVEDQVEATERANA